MRVELAKLHQRLATTMIYVTHDQVEAMTLADRIVVFSDGRIEQVGTPLEIYRRPANLFVAGFIGAPKMNLIEARVVTVSPGQVEVALPGGRAVLAAEGRALTAGAPVTFGVRPEHVRPTSGEGIFRGRRAPSNGWGAKHCCTWWGRTGPRSSPPTRVTAPSALATP